MRTGEWVVAENWRLCSTTLVCGVGGELEDENWRLGSTNLVLSGYHDQFSLQCGMW